MRSSDHGGLRVLLLFCHFNDSYLRVLWTTKKQMSGFSKQSWSKEGTVRHRQSKEASVLWSHHEETRELPGERDNARNNARCTKARKATHGLDGQHQDSPWKSQSERQRTWINGESTSVVWSTLGSRTADEQNRTCLSNCLKIYLADLHAPSLQVLVELRL